MVEGSLITPEIKRMKGQEADFPGSEVIDKSSIRRYAQAISDLNPIYFDEEYAEKTIYGGIIAPPTFIFDASNNIFSNVGEDGRDLSRITIPGFRLARGGNEYHFFQPARLGDIINKKRKITDIYERESKTLDRIIFIIYEITYTNQQGKLLGLNRETLMFFK